MNMLPRVSFGMIVLNGEPFVRYNLRALYPFAHEIIVVEGAAHASAKIATPEGHSSDTTMDTLMDFRDQEDPEGKLVIVTAEDEGHPNGFWPGEKDEQSQAYARRAGGDYLWQVDVDEFYKPEEMRALLEMLRHDPEITAVSFKHISFWGGFDYVTDGWYLRYLFKLVHRIFKWGPGYRYVTHRPPTVVDPQGRDLRGLNWVDGYEMARQGIILYHYSLLFPKQVVEKCEYYGQAEWANRSQAQRWAQEAFLELRHPYRVHNVYKYPSWLEHFGGDHPAQIQALRADLEAGRLDFELRSVDDIERLLRSPVYRVGRLVLKVVDPPVQAVKLWAWRLANAVRDPAGAAIKLRSRFSEWVDERGRRKQCVL